ncbi:MAG TPA: hypothetical protein VNI83_11990, partial [Vicinamibacterales bacterium]|nr:hypothetical protein [Vicinamibacterales bacterium]
MTLVADRFLRIGGARYLDIASGEPVLLQAVRYEHARRPWADRCAALIGIWHDALPALLDYGDLVPGVGFEAWGWTPGPGRSRHPMASARRAVRAFLADVGVDPTAPPLRSAFARAARLLAARAEPTGRPQPSSGRALFVGVTLQRRAALDAVVELMAGAGAGGVRHIQCAAPAGAGGRLFLLAAAREARRLGYVPLDAGVAAARPDLLAGLEDRHVLLLERRGVGSDAGGPACLLRLAMRSSRPHLLLTLVPSGPADCELEPIPIDRLLAMVHVYPTGAISRQALERAAVDSRGRPGRFLALLRGGAAGWRHALRVAETRPAFGDAPGDADAGGIALVGPDEERWLARLIQARTLAARGRHAAAIRTAREAAAAFDRRDR